MACVPFNGGDLALTPHNGGKGLSLARRLYKTRILGLALGFFCVAAGMYPLHPSPWVWAFMLFNAFIWPHLAYQWARRSAVPFRGEHRNLLVDAFLGGFWVGAMHFNPLPTTTTLSLMAMNNIALGGVPFSLPVVWRKCWGSPLRCCCSALVSWPRAVRCNSMPACRC